MTAKGFHNKMVSYLGEYQKRLILIKSSDTAESHCSVIHEFINYIYNYHLVAGIDQITVSMANSKFQADYKRKNKGAIPNETMKKILKDFFTFLYEKHRIKNEKLLRGLAANKNGGDTKNYLSKEKIKLEIL